MPRSRGRRRVSSNSRGSRPSTGSMSRGSTSSSTSRVSRPGERPLRRSARISRLSAIREEIGPHLHPQGANVAVASISNQEVGDPEWQNTTEDATDIGLVPSRREPLPRDLLAHPLSEGQMETASIEETTGDIEPYEMEFVIQPPSTVRPGIHLYPPVVIEVRSQGATVGTMSSSIGDMSGIWAFAALTTEDGSEVLSPPRTNLFSGRTADSIHLAMSGSQGPEVGYAVFPNLAIAQPGHYQIRVSLIDMDSNGSSLGRPLQGGTNLQSVNSNSITVTITGGGTRASRCRTSIHSSAAVANQRVAAAEHVIMSRLRARGLDIPNEPHAL